MDYLFRKLSKRADEIEADREIFSDHYRHCINHGFNKLQQCYTKIDDSRLYCAAVALHPCMRFSYFEKAWSSRAGGREQIDNAKRWTRSLFDDYLSSQPPVELAELLFVSSDKEDEDED
jgi:hypothetical protein